MSISAAQLRRMVGEIAGAVDETTADRFVFSVGDRGFAWTYYARVEPKKPRQAFWKVLAVTCPLERKAMLIEAAPEIYFDDAHYRNFPAVLVRLAVITAKELRALLASAYTLQAERPPKRARKKAPTKRKKLE